MKSPWKFSLSLPFWPRLIGRISIALLLNAGMAIGQASSAQKETAPPRALAFGVVSIRQNMSPVDVKRAGPPQFGATPDGYRMTDMPLDIAIMTAFPSQSTGAMFSPDDIAGFPDWAKREGYDIEAKVAEEDLPEWQNPALQPAMLRAMLQTMLAERCKIVVHHETRESVVYLLVIGKNGPKFKETDPGKAHPIGTTLPGGATIVPSSNALNLYGTSMNTLATLLSGMGKMGRPIQDRTGLTGRYDIVIPKPAAAAEGAGPVSDSSDVVYSALEALGLKLQSGKSTVETLVVDHIERPTAN